MARTYSFCSFVQWVNYEQGFLVAGGLCIVLAAVFTFVSLLIACCRCCLSCRRRVKYSNGAKPRCDKKHDSCRRHACDVILAVLTVVMVYVVEN